MGIEDSAIHGHCAWPPAPAAPAETLQRLVAKLRELSREALDKDIDELYHHLWPPPDIEEWRALLQAFASKAARVSREALQQTENIERRAFFAAYHAQWRKDQGLYCFDPLMSPGDPEGCYRAWRASVSQAADGNAIPHPIAPEVSREAPVTRVEVIGDRGRVWGRWHLDEVTLSYQDGGRTLKIFVRGDTKPPQKQVRG